MREFEKNGNLTLLVTGGAGFIGSCFVLYWNRVHPEDRIVCLDKLTYAADLTYLEPVMKPLSQPPADSSPDRGKPLSQPSADSSPDRGKPLRPASQGTSPDRGGSLNFRFVKADICDREAVNALFEEEHFDIVVNFAAESHVDRSIADSGVFLQTNVTGTGVLLDACRKYGIKRFHQISTDEVYGDLPLEAPGGEASAEAEQRFTESSPLHPNNPYSASKAAADLLVLAYRRTYGLPVTISRSCNNYGPRQHPEKLIPKVIRLAWRNEPVPVFGDGRNLRDWLYVEDCCRALEVILQKGTEGEVYNIAAGHELPNLDLVRQLLLKLGRPETLIRFVADRPGHDRRYTMDASKLKALGWEPEVPFEDGLKETIAWYETHRNASDTAPAPAPDQPHCQAAAAALREAPSEETLWSAVIAFQNCPFRTVSGLPFTYTLKTGRSGTYTKELLIDRRENSKSLAWSSVLLAFQAALAKQGQVIARPKALGDIRGVSYLYPMLWRFGLITVPEDAARNMGPDAGYAEN